MCREPVELWARDGVLGCGEAVGLCFTKDFLSLIKFVPTFICFLRAKAAGPLACFSDRWAGEKLGDSSGLQGACLSRPWPWQEWGVPSFVGLASGRTGRGQAQY